MVTADDIEPLEKIFLYTSNEVTLNQGVDEENVLSKRKEWKGYLSKVIPKRIFESMLKNLNLSHKRKPFIVGGKRQHCSVLHVHRYL